MANTICKKDAANPVCGVCNRILFNKGTESASVICSDYIISMTLTEAINSSDGINMGATCSNKLTVEMLVPPGLAFATAVLEPYVTENDIDIPLGKFYVCDATTVNGYNTVTLECYDAFCKTEQEYKPSEDIVFPATAETIALDIAAQTGFEINFDFAPYQNCVIPRVDGYTCRQMLGYIAGMMGKNAHFGRDGKLIFKWYEDKDITVTRDEQYQNQLQFLTEEDFCLMSVTAGSGDEVFTKGSGSGIAFENPYISEAQLETVLNSVKGFTYRPCSFKYRGNLGVEVGQRIKVKDTLDNDIYVCVMEQVILLNGGMQANVYSYGKSKETYNFESSNTSTAVHELTRRLEKAVMMTDNINNSKGGVFEVIDSDKDGINDSFIIRMAGGEGRYIRGNKDGIGFSNDGGKTYTTAIDHNGICTEALHADEIWSAQIGVEGITREDVFSVARDKNGHVVLTLGSGSNDILLRQENGKIGFYTKDSATSENPRALCELTSESFTMQTTNVVRFGGLKIFPDANETIIFSTGGKE